MHLLNTLPQRLDPGATPTFAGLIAPSLTSPAGNNLTLGLGTGGTALTLANNTLAATFAGSVTLQIGSLLNFVGGGSTVYSIQGATSASPYDFRFIGAADAVTQRNFSFGYYTGDNAANAWNQKAAINSYTGAATFAGAVTVSSSTAGSSSAGALVVTGGLSAGAASYFGGDVTLSKATPALSLVNTSASTFAQFLAQSTVNRSIIVGQFGDSSAGTTLGIANAAGALIATATTGANYPDKLTITTTGRAAPIYFGTNNTLALTLDGTTQAATFAGAVSITGNVGFYGQAATAKPTGVAVTAAAIHAALVTLNLIAA